MPITDSAPIALPVRPHCVGLTALPYQYAVHASIHSASCGFGSACSTDSDLLSHSRLCWYCVVVGMGCTLPAQVRSHDDELGVRRGHPRQCRGKLPSRMQTNLTSVLVSDADTDRWYWCAMTGYLRFRSFNRVLLPPSSAAAPRRREAASRRL